MAKPNKATKTKKVKPAKATVVALNGRRTLDQHALAYARLLADPCGAPTVHPVYSGGEGGYLMRADSFFTFGAGGTDTAAALSWTPGAVGTTNSEITTIVGTTPGTSANAVGNANSPGKNFLTANCSAMRCVAACMKITYPGTESGRSGRIHFGGVSGSIMNIGTGYTPDGIAQLLPHYCRIPADTIELIWKPNDADQRFTDPRVATGNNEKDAKAALAIAFAGLPTATGVVVHLTAVYEWQPSHNIGLANPSLSKSPSNNTLDEVVNYLIARGQRFVHGAGAQLGAGIISGMAQTYGLIASGVAQQRLTGF